MAVPISRCRGFTNPVIFLIRNSLETSVHQSSRAASTSRLRWSARSLTTGRPLGAQPKPRNKVAPIAASKPPSSPPPRAARASPPPPSPPPPPAGTAAVLAKTTKTTTTPGSSLPSSSSPSSSPPQLGYAQSLARGSTPTTLYEAPPQRVFLASSYLAGLFGTLAAGTNVWFNVYNVPEGTGAWVAYVFGAVGVVMAALGTRFALMPASVVRSIVVLPAAPAAAPAAAAAAAKKGVASVSAAAAAAAAATAAPPVLLEIKVRRLSPFPFLPLKRMRVAPDQVVMRARLYNPPSSPPLTLSERMARQRDEERRREAAQQYERDHLMTAPFRHGARAASAVLASVRRGITGEGFAPIEVGGARYKLDITRAYALDDGRALDRIVRIEEDPRVAKAKAAAAAASQLRR